MSTTVTQTPAPRLSGEMITLLRDTAVREMSLAGDNLAHVEGKSAEETDGFAARAVLAVAAFRDIDAGLPVSNRHVAFLAGAQISWEASDDEVRLPGSPGELEGFMDRVDRHRELIALRDAADEETSAAPDPVRLSAETCTLIRENIFFAPIGEAISRVQDVDGLEAKLRDGTYKLELLRAAENGLLPAELRPAATALAVDARDEADREIGLIERDHRLYLAGETERGYGHPTLEENLASFERALSESRVEVAAAEMLLGQLRSEDESTPAVGEVAATQRVSVDALAPSEDIPMRLRSWFARVVRMDVLGSIEGLAHTIDQDDHAEFQLELDKLAATRTVADSMMDGTATIEDVRTWAPQTIEDCRSTIASQYQGTYIPEYQWGAQRLAEAAQDLVALERYAEQIGAASETTVD